MATRKSRPRKTIRRKSYRTIAAGKRTTRATRRRRSSTAGKILPPLDVRSPKHLKEFEKRIKAGPLTIILVYADWCGHCHTMMPHFDAASKSPSRSIQTVKVNEQMLSDVNRTVNKSINQVAPPLNVEGYPSIIVVDKKANKVTDLEPIRNTATMTKVMSQAGPLAESVGLNVAEPEKANSVVKTSIQNIAKEEPTENNQANTAVLTAEEPATIATELGVEEKGLVNRANSPKNVDVGEESMLGSIASSNNKNKTNNKSFNLATRPRAEQPQKESIKESIAPSPLNSFALPKNQAPTLKPTGNIKKEAEEVTSLTTPLSPPSTSSDIEEAESISNSLTPEQKLSGGGRRGGSLYSSISQATYTLAPAAALLATAAMVMKGKHGKTRRHTKKHRKSLRHRR